MNKIENFEEIRRDGLVVGESMKPEDIFALGQPEKIVEIRWRNGNRPVALRFDHGVLAKVITGREYLAVNASTGSESSRILSVFNADGSLRLRIDDTPKIQGKSYPGVFRWFECAHVKSPNVFGVVFSRTIDGAMFHLDIDASDGSIVEVHEVR